MWVGFGFVLGLVEGGFRVGLDGGLESKSLCSGWKKGERNSSKSELQELFTNLLGVY